MLNKLVIAFIALFIVTPLLISEAPLNTRLMALTLPGLALIFSLFYSGLYNTVRCKVAAKNVNWDWFIGYLVFIMAMPSIITVTGVPNFVIMLSIVMLFAGAISNGFYIVSKSPIVLVVCSALYGSGFGLFSYVFIGNMLELWKDPSSGIGALTVSIAVSSFISGMIVKTIAGNINLFSTNK